MWLQRYISQPMRLFIPATVVFVAGCASTGPEVADRRAPDAEVVAAGQEILPEIPAQARTLFEQAVSVMAAGDFLDAELRFRKRVVLRPQERGE